MVRAQSPTRAKLIGSKNAGGYLASKVVVLKGKGGGERRLHLPLDLLPAVCTYPACKNPLLRCCGEVES